MSAKVFNSPAIMAVFERVAQERNRQNTLFVEGHIPFNCASRVADPNRKLRVLVEEVGEVAEAIDHLEQLNSNSNAAARQREHLRDELVQVAAVAVAWLESMEGAS
jgi:hypothetical protein